MSKKQNAQLQIGLAWRGMYGSSRQSVAVVLKKGLVLFGG